MARTSSHIIETKTRDYVRSVIDNYYKNGDALFRELSERDYGIDGLIELFCDGVPTGQICLVQIKGTANKIRPLRSKNAVSCSISTSNAQYARQNNIPILLIYATITKPEDFYYIDINRAVTDMNLPEKIRRKSITIHIPIENKAKEDLDPLFETIRSFYGKGENRNGTV